MEDGERLYSFESEDSVASYAMGASILGFGGNHRRLLKEAVLVRKTSCAPIWIVALDVAAKKCMPRLNQSVSALLRKEHSLHFPRERERATDIRR